MRRIITHFTYDLESELGIEFIMKMQNRINYFLFGLLLIIFCTQSFAADNLLKKNQTTVNQIKVINMYPHDPEAYTQGLFYRDGFLYESTGLKGKSSLRKVDLISGKISVNIKLADEYFGEGIALLGGNIYQLTWKSKVGFIYNHKDFKKIGRFNYESEGWGITTDGKILFMSNGTSQITCHEPKSFKCVRILNVRDGKRTIDKINELEFVAGQIWANIFLENVIARISPTTGKVLGWVDLRPLYYKLPRFCSVDVLNGIAYDEKNARIFVTGKYWPYIFEIEVIE